LPFTQFDAFAAGAAIPLFGLQKMQRAFPWLLCSLGLAAFAGLLVLVADQLWHGGAYFQSLGFQIYMAGNGQYVWGYSLINLVSLLAIVCAIQEHRATRFLSSAILVRIGKVSYGAYVYHYPLWIAATALIATQTTAARTFLFVGWFAAVLLLSEASFRWLETPFLRLKGSRQRVDVVAASENVR
jgi:peptidoglycan/LPS O-acetylase OafA/YrhL